MLNKIMLSEKLRNRRLVDLYEEGILKLGDEIPYKYSEESYLSPEERNGYGDQSFSTKDVEMKWQAIGVEEIEGEKCLKLIAKKPIYEFEFMLKGAEGCVYGIEELNKISQLFAIGRGALQGKSITIEDVNQLFDVKVDENRRIVYQKGIYENINEMSSFMKKYHLYEQLGSQPDYPHLWWQEPPRYPEHEYTPSGYLKNEPVECTEICTNFYYSIHNITGKEKEKEILFIFEPRFQSAPWLRSKYSCWLASPSKGIVTDRKDTRIEHLGFGIKTLYKEFAGVQSSLFLSGGNQYEGSNLVRPIIYLKPKATLNTFLEESVQMLLRQVEEKKEEEEKLIRKIEELIS